MTRSANWTPKGITPAHVDYIAHERRKGTTWDAISKTVGIPPKTLSAWWAKRGPYSAEHAKPRRDTSKLTPRACLRCKITFDSEGPHNRMCSRCRHID